MMIVIVRIVLLLCLWVVIQANTLLELEQRIKEKIDATLAERKRKNSAIEGKKAKEQQLSYFSVKSNPSAPKKEVKVPQPVDSETFGKKIDSAKTQLSKPVIHNEFSVMKNRDKDLILSTSDVIDRLFGSSKANHFLSFLQEASNSSEKVKELLKNSFNVQQLLPDEYSISNNEGQTRVFFSTVLSSILFNASFAFVKQEKMRKNKLSSKTAKNKKFMTSSIVLMSIGDEINEVVEQVLTCLNSSSSADFQIHFLEILLRSPDPSTSLTSPIMANHYRHYLPLHEPPQAPQSSLKNFNPSLTPQSFLPWLRFTLDSYQSSQVFFFSLQITHYSDLMRILQLLQLTSASSQHLFPFIHIQLPRQWWLDSQLSEHHPQRREALKAPPPSFDDHRHHHSVPHVRFTAVELISYLEVNGYLIYQIGKRSLLPLNSLFLHCLPRLLQKLSLSQDILLVQSSFLRDSVVNPLERYAQYLFAGESTIAIRPYDRIAAKQEQKKDRCSLHDISFIE